MKNIKILFVAMALHGPIFPCIADPGFLEEIVVVGNKTEQPLWRVAGRVKIFDREVLDRLQLQDLGAISRYSPSLATDVSENGGRFGSTGLSIRGLGGNRVGLEIDGVPLPQQYHIGSFADSGRLTLDPAIIKRIEILRGPASALYGSDSIGGVVVISTVDGKDLVPIGEQHYFGGSNGYFSGNKSVLGSTTYAWAEQDDSLVLSINHRTGQEADNKSHNVDSDRIDFSQWQLFGKWAREFQNGSHLRASMDYFTRDTDSDLRARLGYGRQFGTTTQLLGDDEQARYRITAEYTLPAFDWLDYGGLVAYYQKNRTEQFTEQYRGLGRGGSSGPGVQERDFFFTEHSLGGEFKLRRDFSTGGLWHALVAGVEWDRRKLTEKRDALETNFTTGAMTKTLLGETFPLRDIPLSTTEQVGLFIQDNIRLGNVTIIPALRWDYFDIDSQADSLFPNSSELTDLSGDDLTLRVGATWQATDSWSVYGHYAEGFRAPPAEEVNLYLNLFGVNAMALPNPDLRPERSRNLEAGFRLDWRGTALEATAYHSRYDDFIESRARVGTTSEGILLFQSRNLEEATVYGVELEFKQALSKVHEALQNWRVDAGLHWAHGDNDITDTPLNSVNPFKAVAGLRWGSDTSPLASELRITHYGRQARVDFSGGQFFVPDSATVADLILQWGDPDRLQWYLGIYNLTDRRYWRYADVRRLDVGDPQIEITSQPGINVALTLHVNY